MRENILSVERLTKRYSDFCLDNVSLSVPYGSVVGLVGENGAGKSTLIKIILGLANKNEGDVTIFNVSRDNLNKQLNEKIGVVFDDCNLPGNYTTTNLNKVLRTMYLSWDETMYYRMLNDLSIPLKKKIKNFSKGMKMKLSIIISFCHKSQFLILDESTSGLDPVARDEILNLLLEFVQDEKNAILLSSHITSDLEKIADYIAFIHKGKIMFQLEKDSLLYQYGLIKCTDKEFEEIDREDVIRYRKLDYETQVLIADKEKVQSKYPSLMIAPVTIDEIMLHYIRGEKL